MNRLFCCLQILIFLMAEIFICASTAQAFSGASVSPHGIIHCRQKQGTQSDTSNVALGFAGGTLTNMTWDGTKLVLSAGQTTGNFISRIFDSSNCHGITPWSNFAWTTTLPFYKELPSASETAVNYSAQSAGLMTSLRGLWHLNEASYNGTANEVVDSSGNNHHGRLIFGTATNSTGLFNGAYVQPSSAHQLEVTNLPNQTEVFTHQFWIKTTDTAAWALMAMRRNASNNGWSIQVEDTFGLPYLRVDTSAGSNQTGAGSSIAITDGKWHHIVLTMNTGNAALWVDGVKATFTYSRGTGLSSAANLKLSTMMVGSYEEVAMWDRVLTDSEILQLYRRGANRVKVQLRTCVNSNCSDAPVWKGTDATVATYFTELNNNSNQGTGLGTVQTGAPNMILSNFPSVIRDYRYFQYKIIMETDNTTYSPDIKSVGISK